MLDCPSNNFRLHWNFSIEFKVVCQLKVSDIGIDFCIKKTPYKDVLHNTSLHLIGYAQRGNLLAHWQFMIILAKEGAVFLAIMFQSEGFSKKLR